MRKCLLFLSASILLHPTLVMAEQITKDAVVATPVAASEKKDTQYAWMDNLSGQFDITSNYVFRGVSQTANLPAVQGGLTYTFPIGLYFNVWGSNVRFPGTDATIELDMVGGWGGTLFKEQLTYDVHLTRYNYPHERHLNYNELNTLFNYKFLQFGVSYSANAYNTHDSGTYYNGGVNYDIPAQYIFNVENMNFTALFGHYSLPRAAGNSYNDWQINLSKKIKNYTLLVQWTDTNGRQHNPPYDSGHLVGSVTVDF